MKFGLSSYSLQEALRSGEMTILDVIRWAADHGSEHIEMVPFLGKCETNLFRSKSEGSIIR